MIKLYKTINNSTHYWETWENKNVFTIHWGQIGEKGQSIEIRNSLFHSALKTVKLKINEKIAEGYAEFPEDNLKRLLIEYSINEMGNEIDLDKRHRLENRMNETLGWTGLGNCDGGSIGSGTMEVCCFVVDFKVAKAIIEADLKDSEFKDYKRIYEEN